MLRSFESRWVVGWIRDELRIARRHGWRGQVISGYRSCASQKVAARAFAARVGQPLSVLYPHGVCASNHCGKSWPRGAVDVTDAAGLFNALSRAGSERGRRRLVWASSVGFNDPSHFSASGH